ncbi:MAG: hypothetical protein NTV98_01100 [Candidatus Roizmanbacteria bacterium]|nr:hypothetical protein [Candidatus Roizmanbacteria bacterium]
MKFIYTQPHDWTEQEKTLAPYIDHCKQVVATSDYNALEASLCLSSDKEILAQVDEMIKKKKTNELKYIIVIGIGGSNLGTKALYDSLYGSVDVLTPDRYPKMFFLDTIDPKANTTFLNYFDKYITNENEFSISIISKSGGTTEPLVNAEILLGHLKKQFPNWKDRCVIITDNNSKMWDEGKRIGIDVLGIPKKVGGRYSILSAVGLFPLAMAGIDIRSLLKGAESMRSLCISDTSENHARSSSIFQYLYLQEGKAIHNSFYFHPELESLGKWYRQLVGESIGKDNIGVTPMVSIGSVDHHSMVQLYWGGPSDKTTELVYSKKQSSCLVPSDPLFPTLSTTEGKDTAEIVSAIQKGTALTYENQKQPYFEVVLDDINEYEIGAYMQYKMMEILYLAHLMKVNAFDQPQVELYKIETRKILVKK